MMHISSLLVNARLLITRLPKIRKSQASKWVGLSSFFSILKQDSHFTSRFIPSKKIIVDSLNKDFIYRLRQARSTPDKKLTVNASFITELEVLKKIQEEAGMATIPYTRDFSMLKEGWEVDINLAKIIADTVDTRFPNGDSLFGCQGDRLPLPTKDAAFIDPHSGLTGYLFVNHKIREIKIIFGGTTSGKNVSDDYSISRLYLNKLSTANQCIVNLQAALGVIPQSYKQGAYLTQLVQAQLQLESSPYFGYTARTVGHSLGAGIAVYSALAQILPLSATGFSSAHLGVGLIKKLPKENVNRAENLISHFFVKKDWIPNLPYIVPFIKPLGKSVVFPISPSVKGIVHIHAQFYEHICNMDFDAN